MKLLLLAIRLFLNSLVRVAPGTAGALAFRLFCTPLVRARVPDTLASVMNASQRSWLDVHGEKVAVYRWPAQRTEAPRVLLAHGWQSRAGRIANWVEPLRRAGFEVLAFDGPAHGESTGRTAQPLRFAAAIRALAREIGPVHAIVAHSMGALAALCAVAGGHLENEADLDVERLVIVAGAESGVAAMAYFCRALGLREEVLDAMSVASERQVGFSASAFEGHRLMAGSHLPVLWFHDPADDEVTFAGAVDVERAAPGLTLVTTAGLGHHRIVRDPDVVARGVDFLLERRAA